MKHRKVKPKPSPKGSPTEIMPPKTVLKAAMIAPRVFSIGAYFRAIYLMREKGHSWRYLAEWLKRFNIEISHVHLSRLFAQEDERLSQLSRKELSKAGMPPEMIDNLLKKSDPTKRLTSIDPEDIDIEEEGKP
jgi:hypothetical protein